MEKRMKGSKYWVERARSYDAATDYVVGEETQRETKKWLAEQIKATDDVLEMGCGTGQFSEVIAGKGRHLTAADGVLQMLDMTSLRLSLFSNIIVQMEDCYRTTFPDGTFDVVFLGNVIHILRWPMKALTESWRVLKPGGRILVADATSFAMPFWSKLAMGIRYLKKFGLPPRENRIVNLDDVSRWLEAADFQVEESRLIQKETNMVCAKREEENVTSLPETSMDYGDLFQILMGTVKARLMMTGIQRKVFKLAASSSGAVPRSISPNGTWMF